jgi:hypothetical protein
MQNTTQIMKEDWHLIKAAAKAQRSSNMRTADDNPDTSILQQYHGQIYIPQPKPTA